jgi:uncharacterized protein (DUF2141 family)
MKRAALLILAAPLLGAWAPAELVVEIRGLRNTRGTVQICLTSSPQHFPDCKDDGQALRRSVSAAQASEVTLPWVSGLYALSLVHDENGNGKLDTALGIPREGYGFSRDAPVRLGPPNFANALFSLPGGRTTIVVNVRYIL